MKVAKLAIPMTALAALAVALFAPGCGDGGPTKVSAAELVTRGDAICREEQQKFAEVQAEPPASAGDADDQSGELADAAGKELDSLRDLEPPSAVNGRYDDYLDSMQAAVKLLENGQDAASGQDAKRYGELQAELAASAEKRSHLAHKVGFKTCSTVGDPPPAAVAAP